MTYLAWYRKIVRSSLGKISSDELLFLEKSLLHWQRGYYGKEYQHVWGFRGLKLIFQSKMHFVHELSWKRLNLCEGFFWHYNFLYTIASGTFCIIFLNNYIIESQTSDKWLEIQDFFRKTQQHSNKSVFYLSKLLRSLKPSPCCLPLYEIRPECHLEGWTWAKKKTPHHFWHLMITPYRNFPSNSLLHKKQSKIGFAFAGFPRRRKAWFWLMLLLCYISKRGFAAGI